MRAVVFHGTQVLLVRELDGRWSMPGGYADVNVSPSEATAREMLAESGYAVRPLRLLAVYDRRRQGSVASPFHTFYTLLFDCELLLTSTNMYGYGRAARKRVLLD